MLPATYLLVPIGVALDQWLGEPARLTAQSPRLGSPAIYHGQLTVRPELGEGRPAKARELTRAFTLVQRALWLWLWLAVLISGGLTHA